MVSACSISCKAESCKQLSHREGSVGFGLLPMGGSRVNQLQQGQKHLSLFHAVVQRVT